MKLKLKGSTDKILNLADQYIENPLIVWGVIIGLIFLGFLIFFKMLGG